jgi:tetratricopeptide (TPR) repeat protein
MARSRTATVEKPPAPTTSAASGSARNALVANLSDGVLVSLFLVLTFLLGVFPLKDTDFWWHLRTGELIRESWRIPVTDWYTFGAPDAFWVDLHWGFEVLLSWGHQQLGVPGLNLAKCAITTMALAIMLWARRGQWPIWVMVLAWMPALLVLGGRMYVRPETLTLLYLAIFLAVLFWWDKYPRLGFVLPVVQVLWVNTQGLFVFGPVVLGCALIDAALTPGAFSKAKRPWWRTAGLVGLLTGLACLINPYGLVGTLFPLQLARTMTDPIFSSTIAELTPILSFIEQSGYRNLPLQLHLATAVLGALSFLIPIVWRVIIGLIPSGRAEPARAGRSRRTRKVRDRKTLAPEDTWRPRVFRILLYAGFTVLSFKATRNSHQFAAVVGCVTAWNLGEWASALRRRRELLSTAVHSSPGVGRLLALAAVTTCLLLVATGRFYAWAGEGRTVALGEERLWFPHAAARSAGRPGMPERFLCFHNGLAGLFEYYNGPDRKVFADARLEVIGPDVYRESLNLERDIRLSRPEWSKALETLGRPGILTDHLQPGMTGIAATLLASPDWRCVWFDPLASVFIPAGAAPAVPPIDFLARSFGRDSEATANDVASLGASAKALHDVAYDLTLSRGRIDVAGPLVLLGLNHARRACEAEPAGLQGWKYLGLLEAIREPAGSLEEPVFRFRQPFDPVFDLSPARATYALLEALKRDPLDRRILVTLATSYESRGMFEAALPMWRQLAELDPSNHLQSVTSQVRGLATRQAAGLLAKLGPEPGSAWNNMAELDRAVAAHLDSGRAAGAADLLDRAYPARARTWKVADRLATLYMHLGRPAEARRVWEQVQPPNRPALRPARTAATHVAENHLVLADRAYRDALALEPTMFEALYGLAVLDRDTGQAAGALDASERAEANAPTEFARSAAHAIAEMARPYATARAR